MPWFGYLSLLDSAILISMTAFSLAALIRSCYDSEWYWKEFPFYPPNRKKLSLAWQKNHLERQNAWKVWSLKGPLSCSKSKKAKGWVWHLSYWTSDFRLFIFDIKHLNLTQPNLEKKTKQRMNNSLERNGEIEAPWFWEKYFSLYICRIFLCLPPLKSDRQRHPCETERDLDVSGLEVSLRLSEHPHTHA